MFVPIEFIDIWKAEWLKELSELQRGHDLDFGFVGEGFECGQVEVIKVIVRKEQDINLWERGEGESWWCKAARSKASFGACTGREKGVEEEGLLV